MERSYDRNGRDGEDGMTDLDRLIEAVEAGTFLTDLLDVGQETLAYDAFSGSLDAANALHDALLPGWEYTLDAGDGALVENRADFGVTYSVDASKGSIARCWLLAILRAYRSHVQS